MVSIDATIFIPLVIIAVVEIIKGIAPTVKQFVTVLVAIVVGIIIALLDTHIGVQDITVAQGVVCGLEAVGITTAIAQAGGGTSLTARWRK